MNRLLIATLTQTAMMLLVLVGPTWVSLTGKEILLETEKMDPRSLFRGDYVILGYQEAQGILGEGTQGRRDPVYVVFSTEQPARYLRHGFEPPTDLADNEACIVGRTRGWSESVDFPQIAQYFVPEGTGRALEDARGDNLLARVKTSDGCKAVLLELVLIEPEHGAES